MGALDHGGVPEIVLLHRRHVCIPVCTCIQHISEWANSLGINSIDNKMLVGKCDLGGILGYMNGRVGGEG